jgi:hypothetical protein
MRRGAWVVALVPLVAVLAGRGTAQAQGSDGAVDAGAVSARVVEIVVVGGGRDAATLLDTVRELLGRIGLVVEAHAVAAPTSVAALPRGSAAARVQVDLRAPDEVVILTEGRRQAPKQRTVRRDPSPIVAREELAQAIQSAVEAQLFTDPEGGGLSPPTEGVDAGPAPAPTGPAPVDTSPAPPAPRPPVAPPPMTPPEPAPALAPVLAREAPAPARPPSSVAVEVSALAGGGGFAGATGPVVALGGDVTLASRRGWRPSLSLSGREVLPFDASQDSVTCHASAFAVRALGAVELARASWVALAAGGGAGADVLWAQPRSAVLDASVLGPATTHADPVVSAFVAARVAVVPGVVLTVMALGDLDLAPTRYVVFQGGAADPVLSPWRVRPTLLAGLTFVALGPPAFAGSVP